MDALLGTLDVLYISESTDLDPITVFWQNFKPGQGSVTLTCYGDAWTAWFGAMGADTAIQQFFAKADVSYLCNKMSPTFVRLNQTQTKRQDHYLGRIIEAIKKEMAVREAAGELCFSLYYFSPHVSG